MIKVSVSKVAGLIGLNPFQDPQEALEELHCAINKRPPPAIYRAIQATYANSELKRVKVQFDSLAHNTQTSDDVKRAKEAVVKDATNETERTNKKLDEARSKLDDVVKSVESSEEVVKSKIALKEAVSFAKSAKSGDEMKRAEARVKEASAIVEATLNPPQVVKAKEIFKLATKDAESTARHANSIIEYARHTSNTSFGTRKETRVTQRYESDTLRKVVKSNKILTHFVNDRLKVVGKVDGICEDGSVLEVKNRINGMFNRLREYENVQIQLYMLMTDAPYAHLVESYDGLNNIIKVDRDFEFTNQVISKLSKVIDDHLHYLMN